MLRSTLVIFPMVVTRQSHTRFPGCLRSRGIRQNTLINLSLNMSSSSKRPAIQDGWKEEDFFLLDQSEEAECCSGELRAVLRADVVTTKRMLRLCPQLGTESSSNLTRRLEQLLALDVTIQQVHFMPWLLTMTEEAFDFKITEVTSTLDLKFHYALPFTKLSLESIFRIRRMWNMDRNNHPDLINRTYTNRLELISAKLDDTEGHVILMCAKNIRISSMSLDRILAIMKILLEGGVRKDVILEDPWIFSHNITLMQERVDEANKHGVTDIRTWMLRCHQSIFEKHISKLLQEKELLHGHESVKGFLMEQLQCSEADVEKILRKVPAIKNASATKLHGIIQFLYNSGYTPDQILETPRILARSKETVAARCAEMQSYKFFLPTALSLLCLNSKSYFDLVKRLSMRKTKTDSKTDANTSRGG